MSSRNLKRYIIDLSVIDTSASDVVAQSGGCNVCIADKPGCDAGACVKTDIVFVFTIAQHNMFCARKQYRLSVIL